MSEWAAQSTHPTPLPASSPSPNWARAPTRQQEPRTSRNHLCTELQRNMEGLPLCAIWIGGLEVRVWFLPCFEEPGIPVQTSIDEDCLTMLYETK